MLRVASFRLPKPLPLCSQSDRDKFTVYPPLSELAFAALGGIAYKPWIFKFAFMLAELAVIPLLAAMGGRFRWLALYAVNPVPVISFAGEAHFDSLMVLATVAAVFFPSFSSSNPFQSANLPEPQRRI